MEGFTFSLGQEVKVTISGEKGVVYGRAQYRHSENSYWIHYKAADGRAQDAWWEESKLTAI